MTAPMRVRLIRRKGWRLPGNTVVVTRPGPWGNPFVIGKDGGAAECVRLYELVLRGETLPTTQATVADQLALRRHWLVYGASLAGVNLACWCALDRPCHADVLLRASASLNSCPRHELLAIGHEGARQGLELADCIRAEALRDPGGAWAAVVEGHDLHASVEDALDQARRRFQGGSTRR